MKSPEQKRRADWTARTAHPVWLAATLLLFALAAVKFAYEDRVGFDYPVNDLISPWVSAKAFLEGRDPFNDKAEFARIWSGMEYSPPPQYADFGEILKRNPMIYPPTALPVLAPLTLFPWKVAVGLHVALSLASFAALLAMLAGKLTPDSPMMYDPKKLFLVSFGLAMIPLHSAIRESNPGILAAACAGLGVLFMTRRPYLAGVLLGLGVCLKPQIAFLFFAYPFLRQRWKAALTALTVCGAVLAGSLLWMQAHGVDGMRSYLDTMNALSSLDSDTSFSQPGLKKYSMINLQVLVYQLTHARDFSNLASWAVFLILGAIAVHLICTRISDENELWGVAILSVLTLLPVYQRVYNAGILIFVLYWALENWERRVAKAALCLMLPWLVPITAILQKGAVGAFVVRHGLAASFVWNTFVMPHLIWIELLLAVISIFGLYGCTCVKARKLPKALRATG